MTAASASVPFRDIVIRLSKAAFFPEFVLIISIKVFWPRYTDSHPTRIKRLDNNGVNSNIINKYGTV